MQIKGHALIVSLSVEPQLQERQRTGCMSVRSVLPIEVPYTAARKWLTSWETKAQACRNNTAHARDCVGQGSVNTKGQFSSGSAWKESPCMLGARNEPFLDAYKWMMFDALLVVCCVNRLSCQLHVGCLNWVYEYTLQCIYYSYRICETDYLY